MPRPRPEPESEPLYRMVIFDSVEPDELPAVRDLFCRVTGIHPTDATQWIAKAPGVWPRPLPESQARTLLERPVRSPGGGRGLEG